MSRSYSFITLERIFGFAIAILILLSLSILTSIAPLLFPTYFIYIALGILVFIVFSRIDFEIFVVFAPYLYVASLIFLCLPLAVGEITRGAIRWIQIGSITLQPSELVRPFLLLFFARFVAKTRWNFKTIVQAAILGGLPIFLILVQPSFGVSLLTAIGFAGIVLSTNFSKKYFFIAIGLAVLAIPLLWFMLAPYQKDRVLSFLNPTEDPLGAGYNSLQSIISIGSGGVFGRGLGEGIQTQLAFLPERHSDFIFASIAEEIGLIGTLLLLGCTFLLFWTLVLISEKTRSSVGRAYILGVCLALFAETMIHAGMNMGMLPITGVPYPLVSAGGSALLGTMMSFGIIISSYKSSSIFS
jgi:rod shape determining protein RodA